MNCACGKPLKESLKRVKDGKRIKSCPHCSKQVGRHTFFSEDDFGMRNVVADGRYLIQSHCRKCRAKQRPRVAAWRCPPERENRH